MKKKIKRILEKIFGAFGFDFYIIRKNPASEYVLFDKKIWGTFCSQNALINLDNEGIIRADGGESQNVYKELRHYSLLQMAQHVLDNNLDGEFVECGCWRGHSAYCIAKLISNQKSNRKLLIFDSFEGLSERTHHDTTRFNLSKKELEYERKLLSCSEDKVRNVLKDFDFIRYYKGWIPTRFDAIINTKISFLHIDVDLYQPIKDTLEHLYPKIVTGGVIVFDDYGHSSFDGAKKAVDEFLKENKCSFFYEVPMGSAFIIK
jgi:O-methyltransferase